MGDAIQNLRIALEYLIYQIAWLDSGVEQEGTQFPIFHTKKAFRAKKSEYLGGVAAPHRYAIEQMQPFNGGRWLSSLAELANPDKHKTFLRVGGGATVHGKYAVRPMDGAPDSQLVTLDFDAVATVLTADGAAIDATLEALAGEVEGTLLGFRDCFAQRCSHTVPRTLQGHRRRS